MFTTHGWDWWIIHEPVIFRPFWCGNLGIHGSPPCIRSPESFLYPRIGYIYPNLLLFPLNREHMGTWSCSITYNIYSVSQPIHHILYFERPSQSSNSFFSTFGGNTFGFCHRILPRLVGCCRLSEIVSACFSACGRGSLSPKIGGLPSGYLTWWVPDGTSKHGELTTTHDQRWCFHVVWIILSVMKWGYTQANPAN